MAVVLRSRTLFLSIATLCVMFLGVTPEANAYNLMGIKWAGEPAPHVCCANFTYRQFAGHSNDYAGWVNGAAGWSNSLAYAYWRPATVGEEADARDTDNGSVSWDGLSQWRYYTGSNGQSYFSAPVTVTLNYYYTKNYYVNKTTSVAEHELGHAMGLGHAPGCVIMNSNTQSRYQDCHVYQVQPDDAYGVNALY